MDLGPAIAGRFGPHSAEVLFPEPDLPGPAPALVVQVEVKDVRGAPQVVGLSIRSQVTGFAPEPAVITSDLLRSLPLRELRQAVLDRRRGSEALAALKGPRRVGRERKALEHFDEVARVYRAARRAGDHPRQAVAEHFDVEDPTASKYIRRSRDLGLLGESPGRGIAGEESIPKKERRRTR